MSARLLLRRTLRVTVLRQQWGSAQRQPQNEQSRTTPQRFDPNSPDFHFLARRFATAPVLFNPLRVGIYIVLHLQVVQYIELRVEFVILIERLQVTHGRSGLNLGRVGFLRSDAALLHQRHSHDHK